MTPTFSIESIPEPTLDVESGLRNTLDGRGDRSPGNKKAGCPTHHAKGHQPNSPCEGPPAQTTMQKGRLPNPQVGQPALSRTVKAFSARGERVQCDA